jgi:hypothetical protein
VKLRQISEDFIGQKLRELLKSNAYFQKPSLHQTPLYDARSGHDSGAIATGMRLQPMGIPHKPRHRNILGFEKRPGTIRL